MARAWFSTQAGMGFSQFKVSPLEVKELTIDHIADQISSTGNCNCMNSPFYLVCFPCCLGFLPCKRKIHLLLQILVSYA